MIEIHNEGIEISVITTAYNEELFIGRCLRSLINQSFDQREYEIVVVDDCSIDRTPYALTQFKNSIEVFTNKKNIGLPASINKAINLARGKFVVRVDADDFVNYNFLRFLHYYLEVNLDVDAVACDYYLVDDKEEVLSREDCSKNPIGCGIMFKKEHLLDIGLYDASFRLREEEDLRVRFEKKYKLRRLELPLYRYRQHSLNMTSNSKKMEIYKDKLVKKHKGEKKDND